MKSTTPMLLLVLAPATVLGQACETVPPTPWGDPDIGGYWTYVTITPLERPPGYEDRPVLPDDEARAFLAVGHRLIQAELDRQLNADGIVLGGLTNNRTSLVVDPADGRVPELTAYGEARHRRLGFYARGIERGVDGPEDRERYERCIMGRTWPMVPTIEAQWLHVLQTPDHVAFVHEQNSDVRIVPLGADRPVNEAIRLWQGAPQGRWEGDTLVVTTTNLNGKWTLHGDGPNAVFVERIRRTDRDTLEYSVTVHDPEAYGAPWTIGFPIEATAGPLYETACHEGNYSMELMLRGARAVERRAAGR